MLWDACSRSVACRFLDPASVPIIDKKSIVDISGNDLQMIACNIRMKHKTNLANSTNEGEGFLSSLFLVMTSFPLLCCSCSFLGLLLRLDFLLSSSHDGIVSICWEEGMKMSVTPDIPKAQALS